MFLHGVRFEADSNSAPATGGVVMNPELLERILSCKSLPSLPAVALRVIELTSDPNVKLKELAGTIQNDQGLAAKVLRTVNSSFYGLRTPCSTIDRALVMMGLGPVKTLTLGFSLVHAINEGKSNSAFDYVAYWRRGLYTAVGSKALAEAAKKTWGDEAFLSGLLQDIGVMAMVQALGGEYTAVVAKTEGDHRLLARAEAEAFEVTHSEIGAMLAERWRLPAQLVIPVRYHDRPTAAPSEQAEMCRCVGLANLLHDVLTDPDPRASLRKMYELGEQWLSLEHEAMDLVLKRCTDGTRELARLFNLDTGPFADPDAVLKRAEETQREIEAEGDAPAVVASMNSLLKDGGNVDPMTGALSRAAFQGMMQEVVDPAGQGGGQPALVQVYVDEHAALGRDEGQDAQDECAAMVVEALNRQFAALNGRVCRLKPDLFAIGLAGVDPAAVRAAIEGARQELGKPGSRKGITVGLAIAPRAGTAQALVVAATEALLTARKAGGKTVCEQAAKAA